MSDRTNASGFNALRNAFTEFADVQRAQFEAAPLAAMDSSKARHFIVQSLG
jgi:hypothetical protein